jgi:hypothetical protein
MPISEKPPLLYHYTDVNGLYGILKESEIWATNVCFLNDPSEFLHGGDVVQVVLKNFLEKRDSPELDLFIRTCAAAFKTFEPNHVYSASFCDSRDLLSQWRGYASRGGGYAIGFRSESLVASLMERARFKRVEYSRSNQTELAERSLKEAIRQIKTFRASGYPQDPVERAVNWFHAEMIDPRLFMKSETFSEEREWRIGLIGPLDVQFRPSSGILIPYVPVKFKADAICEVLIGPTVPADQSRMSLQMLLNKLDMKHVNVTVSGIPLRS